MTVMYEFLTNYVNKHNVTSLAISNITAPDLKINKCLNK